MRALLVCPTMILAALLAASPEVASAQMKLSPKAAAPGGTETRYFTSIDGLMDGNADVVLKETRQGKTVTAAVLDVCYPVAKNSDRKDRFVVNLQVAGQNLTGTTQSLGEKSPVSVKLLRKPTGDTFEFRGQISIGQAVTEVTSPDNSDLSEKEFLDNQTSDDGITPQPKDFTDVSPEAIAVKVKLDAATEFLKSLKGQDIEVTLASLSVGCDALRAGEQTINMLDHLGGRRLVLLQHLLDQVDAAARAIELVAEQHIGRTGCGAEAAMDAGAQDLVGLRDVGVGELRQ